MDLSQKAMDILWAKVCIYIDLSSPEKLRQNALDPTSLMLLAALFAFNSHFYIFIGYKKQSQFFP